MIDVSSDINDYLPVIIYLLIFIILAGSDHCGIDFIILVILLILCMCGATYAAWIIIYIIVGIPLLFILLALILFLFSPIKNDRGIL